MKVTEQIDALRALAVHPLDYLVVPRTLAMVISMPLLVAEAVGIGIVAGYFVAIFLLEVNGTYYVANMVRWTQLRDSLALAPGQLAHLRPRRVTRFVVGGEAAAVDHDPAAMI